MMRKWIPYEEADVWLKNKKKRIKTRIVSELCFLDIVDYAYGLSNNS